MEKVLQTEHKIELLSKEEAEKYTRYSPSIYHDGIVRIYPENILLNSRYTTFADVMYNFKFRKEDVVVAGYPKTGTTWLQEIVWTMLNNPNFDNPLAHIDLFARAPIFDFPIIGEAFLKAENDFFKDFRQMYPKSPDSADNFPFLELFDGADDHRVFKVHIPPTLLHPDNIRVPKILYIARDPRDAFLSLYYFAKSIIAYNYKGTMEEFCDAYINELLPWGSVMSNFKAWKHYSKNLKNIKFIFYEDLKQNTFEEVQKINEFLGTNLSKENLEKIIDYTSFNKMKERPSSVLNKKDTNIWLDEETKSFFRQGRVGEHKEKLSPELCAKIERAMKIAFEGLDDVPYGKEE